MSNGPGQLVLASASPRRKELLAAAGYDFLVIPSTIREPSETQFQASPAALAESLSFFKARIVADSLRDSTVIGADTIVSLKGRTYGKPSNEQHARRILTELMHHAHEVTTGVTVLDSDTERREISHVVTRVTMTPMPPDRLDAYLAGGLWRGKAGAYGIQDHEDEFVRQLEGSFSNVVGLPMELLVPILSRWGYEGTTPDAT